MIQQYKIEEVKQHASYEDDSFIQFSVRLKESENENCDYFIVFRINYFG